MQVHLPRIRVDRNVRRTALGEGVGEEPWASTDVKEESAAEVVEGRHVSC